MPGTTSTLGYNSQIYCKAHPASGFATTDKIAQTRDLKSPTPEVGKVKVTNNDSPNNTHEYAPGMIEPGDLEIEMVYTKTQALALYTKHGDGNLYDFAEVYTDGGNWTFTGFITKLGTETKTEDDCNMCTVSIQCTTKPVFSATAITLS